MTYEEFAAARLPALLRYALMLTGDPHSAADLVQDTMVKAQLRWRKIVAAEQPERYVRRMITNTYIDLRRGSWLRRVTLRAHPVEPPPVRDHAETTADRDQLWALLSTLRNPPGLGAGEPAARELTRHHGVNLSDRRVVLVVGVATRLEIRMTRADGGQRLVR